MEVQFLDDSYRIPWAIATSPGSREHKSRNARVTTCAGESVAYEGGEGDRVREGRHRRRDRRFDRAFLILAQLGFLFKYGFLGVRKPGETSWWGTLVGGSILRIERLLLLR